MPLPYSDPQILEHQASVLVNQINSINDAPPPSASQDILDVGLIVGEATSTICEMQASTQASLTQARAALDEKRQHIEKVATFGTRACSVCIRGLVSHPHAHRRSS